jgi:beta-lactamase regulating signal transducer with metallopeptidase domain
VANDLLLRLADSNLAAAGAILAVLAIRPAVRAFFGARTAYALWLIVPSAMLASFIPARTVLVAASPLAPVAVAVEPAHIETAVRLATHVVAAAGPDLSRILVAVWLTGVVVSLSLLVVGQRRALAQFGPISADPEDPRLGRASRASVGPALLGVVRPRVIVPADFEARFDAAEQVMILAHERTHLLAGHAPLNALTALIRALNWFNPLIHVAARRARIDQELACDAAVIERFPDGRQTYAQALLKTQLAFTSLPLGCDWPVRSPSLLEKRIRMLALQTPRRSRLLAGAAAVATLSLAAGLAAWSAEPPVRRTAPPAPSIGAQWPVTDQIRQALALGASARDIADMLQANGEDIAPGTAAWVRTPDGKFALGYALDRQKPGRRMMILGDHVPPDVRVEDLPTLDQVLGPPPPPPPPSPTMIAVRQAILAGGSAQDAAAVLAAAGEFGPPSSPDAPPARFDTASARFVRLPGAAEVGLGVPLPGGRMYARQIPGTQSYRGLASLPTAAEAFLQPMPNPPPS